MLKKLSTAVLLGLAVSASQAQDSAMRIITSTTHVLDPVTRIKGIQKIILGYLESFEGASREMHGKHDNPVFSIAITPNGKFIISSKQRKYVWDADSIKVWHAKTGVCFKTLSGQNNRFAVTSDSKYLIIGGFNPYIEIFDFSQGDYIRRFKVLENSEIIKIAVSKDNTFIVLATLQFFRHSYPLYLLDFPTGKLIRKFDGEFADISSLTISEDNSSVIACSNKGGIKKWDISTGKFVDGFSGDSLVNYAVIAGNFSFRVLVDRENVIYTSDAEIGKKIKKIGQHAVAVRSIAVSPDSNYILTGLESETSVLWHVSSGKNIASLGRPLSLLNKMNFFVSGYLDVTAMAMAQDNSCIAAGYSDGVVKLWITQAEEIESLQETKLPAKKHVYKLIKSLFSGILN